MFKFQQPEDQIKFALPLTRDTEHLYYRTRLIIDANVITEPRAWLISKISRESSKGIAIYTATQDLFNQHTDKAFYDDEGNIKYWVADWDKDKILPQDIYQEDQSLISSITSKVTASGNNTQLRIGGSKTFTVNFYVENQLVEHTPGRWQFLIDGADASDVLAVTYPAANKAKIKFRGDDQYIGKILSVRNVTDEGVESSMDVAIIAL